MFEGECDVVAMAEEELNKQDQKESQSEVVRAIRDSITRAAVLLEVAPSTLYRKLRSWEDA